MLTAMTSRRWVRPVQLPPDVLCNDVARIDDATWLVCGRHRSGAGFAAIYDPLYFQLEPLPTSPTALIACAGNVDRSLGLAVGRGGALLTVSARRPQSESVPRAPDCACAAIDVTGQIWTGGSGQLMTRRLGGSWEVAWQGNWQAPFTSLHADVGIVHAMTVEGGIVEGRAVGSMS